MHRHQPKNRIQRLQNEGRSLRDSPYQDLKYGDKRSNPDGSISLMARHIEFEHPVSHQQISVTAPIPKDVLWQALTENINN